MNPLPHWETRLQSIGDLIGARIPPSIVLSLHSYCYFVAVSFKPWLLLRLLTFVVFTHPGKWPLCGFGLNPINPISSIHPTSYKPQIAEGLLVRRD